MCAAWRFARIGTRSRRPCCLARLRGTRFRRTVPADTVRRRCARGSAPLHSWRVALAGVVHELRILLLEGERDFAHRPVAVLGDDQVGLAGSLGVLVVVLVAV